MVDLANISCVVKYYVYVVFINRLINDKYRLHEYIMVLYISADSCCTRFDIYIHIYIYI